MLLLVAMASALVVGPYKIGIGDVFAAVKALILPAKGNGTGVAETVVSHIRLPRILLAALVGGALAVSGAIFQSCFRNPLVEPYILGASSGAAFGAALSLAVPAFPVPVQISAFVFAALAVFGSYFAARRRSLTPVVSLVLAGVIIGSVFAAGVSIMKYLAEDTALREIVFWLMGGLYFASWGDLAVAAPVVLLCIAAAWGMSWKLNVLTMGDEEARSLGVDADKYKTAFILIATLMTAVAVSAAGIIAWVGLMMPHAARMLLGPDNRYTIPAAAFLGAVYMIACDTLARTLTTSEIPVGIITSLLGAPFLLFLLRREGRKIV